MTKKLTGSILLMGAAGDSADLLYASGFSALDPVFFLQTGKRRYLVVPALELGRARDETHGVKVLTPDQLPLTRLQQRSPWGWALGLLRYADVEKVCVSNRFPLSVARRLEKTGIRLTIPDHKLYPRRATKNEREIEHIVSSQQAAAAAMKAAVSMLREADAARNGYLLLHGRRLTSDAVRHVIETTLLRRHCFAAETIVAGGDQAVDPHQRGSGSLRAGEAIVIDIFPQHRDHGYWGDITRTVVKGQPSADLKSMYRAVKAAQAAALARLKPGRSLKSVHQAAVDEFVRRGYATTTRNGVAEGFIHGTGHGVGLEIHEEPRIGAAPGRLRKGHVVTIEPGLYYRGLGGIRIEDTVAITDQGYRYLATFPKRFML